MAGEPQQPTYRVFGVRADGSRTIISENLSPERAKDVADWIRTASTFPDVVIEPEPTPDQDGRQDGTETLP